MTSSESREDSIYFARLSEQGERYEDMIKYMQIVAKVSLAIQIKSPFSSQLSFQTMKGICWVSPTRTQSKREEMPGEQSKLFKIRKSLR